MPKELMDVDGMAQALAAREQGKKPKNSFYKGQSDEHRADEISRKLTTRMDMLKTAPVERNGSIFHDMEEVQKRTFEYLEACNKAGVLPTSLGLSGFAFGVSRQAMDRYLNSHDDEVTRWIEVVKDCINADMLLDMALSNQINAIMSIFALKNMAGMVDKVEITPGQPAEPLGEVMSHDELMRQVQALPDIDMDDD